jgi:hypothetical protein
MNWRELAGEKVCVERKSHETRIDGSALVISLALQQGDGRRCGQLLSALYNQWHMRY